MEMMEMMKTHTYANKREERPKGGSTDAYFDQLSHTFKVFVRCMAEGQSVMNSMICDAGVQPNFSEE